MNKLFAYTFNTDEPEDGVREFQGKPCVRLLNYGAWPYRYEPTDAYGEGRCALWYPRLAAGVSVNEKFQKQNIDRYKRYTLFLRMKVIEPLNDTVKVGFFASSGEFNILNDGPLTGIGPFTKLGNPNELANKCVIKATDIDCSEVTEEFFDVKVSVNGDYLLECLYDALPESYVYVGVMNFRHRKETDHPVIAISEIRVCEKPSYIAFESTKLSVSPDSDDEISVVMKFRHNGLGTKVEQAGRPFRVNSFFCGLFNTMELQTQIIPGSESSTVIIKGFKQIHIHDEFSVSPVLIGADDTGKQRAIFGETVLLSLSDLYRRYFVEKKALPKSILKWFSRQKPAQIRLYNETPVNTDFLGFGALYYPWIYQKDPYDRNYTEEQAATELDRLKASGVRIVRVTLFASSDWYTEETDTWNFAGERFEAILRSLAGIGSRGISVLLNLEWGNSMNSQGAVFGDPKLAAYGFDKQCEMMATFVRDFLDTLPFSLSRAAVL